MSSYRNFWVFLGLAAIWGTAFMAIKAGLDYFPPVLFAAIRYDIAAVVMLGYVVLSTDEPMPRNRSQWIAVLIGGIFLIAAYHSLLFIGQQEVTAALAAVVVALGPILTSVFARGLLSADRMDKLGMLGMSFGFVGVVILARPSPGDLLSANVVATILIFLAAAAFALGSVLVRRIDASIPIHTLEAWSMIIGAILLHLISFTLPNESLGAVEWTVEAVGALLYLALGASAIGYLLYFDLLEVLGPVEINLVSYVVPLFAAIAGWLWLGELIESTTIVGFLVIFTGFYFIKRRELRRFTRQKIGELAEIIATSDYTDGRNRRR